MQQIPTVIERSLWHSCRFSDAETSGRSQLLRVPRCGRCIRTCVCGLSTAGIIDALPLICLDFSIRGDVSDCESVVNLNNHAFQFHNHGVACS